MNLIEDLIMTPQFVLVGLGISFMVFAIRTVLEEVFPKLETSHLFQKVILVVAPIILGALICGCSKLITLPDGLVGIMNKLCYGCCVGGCSSELYRVLKNLLKTFSPSADKDVKDA